MSNLYIQVSANGSPASGKSCSAYLASMFVQNPGPGTNTPSFAATDTQTTDSSGDAEFTGLSGAAAYWILVVDNNGNNWTLANASRVGNSSGTRLRIAYSYPVDLTTVGVIRDEGQTDYGSPFYGVGGQDTSGGEGVLSAWYPLPLTAGGATVETTPTLGGAHLSGLITQPVSSAVPAAAFAVLTSVDGGTGSESDTLHVDTSGFLKVTIAGSAGSTAVTEAELDGAISTPGHATPANVLQVGGSDGTFLRPLLTDTGGQLKVIFASPQGVELVDAGGTNRASISSGGAVKTDGSAVTQPVSGTFFQTTQPVSEATLDATIQTLGSAIPAKAVQVGASDGTDIHPLLLDGSGFLKVNVAAGGAGGGAVWGPDANGATPTEPPVLTAGFDGTDVRRVLTDTSGNTQTVPVNSVLQATTTVTPSTTVTSQSNTAGVSGECVVVTVGNIDTVLSQGNVCVRVRNTTTGISTGWQSCGLLAANVGRATQYHNLPVTRGDTVVVDLIAGTGTFTASKTNVTAVVAPSTVATPLRPDGRGMAIGTLVASVSTAVNGTACIPAPGANWRVLLRTVAIASVSATLGGQGGLYPTSAIGGGSLALVSAAADGEATLNVPEGILFDPNTSAVVAVQGTTTVSVNVLYDIVPA